MRLRLAPLAGYLLLSFAFFGVRLLPHFGRSYVGSGLDPEIFVWSFGWWPHAIGQLENPLVSHAVWAPLGVNLAWTATSPGLALPFAPLTALVGPVAAYNVAAIAMPALAAWTAFLLCLYVTRRPWPSLLGGYLFGFSSYELVQELGHMQVTSVFLLPLIALVVLRLRNGEVSSRRGAVELALVTAWQLTLSTEVALTATLAVAVCLALTARGAGRVLVPVVAAYALAAIIVSPLLYYAFSDFETGSINDPTGYSADLLNFVVPTGVTAISGHTLNTVSQHFPGNTAERGAYLGLPLLAIVVWFGVLRGARFLLVAFGLAALASLGTALFVDGHRVVALPWALVAKLPGFDNVLPVRLAVFTALAAAVIAALWANDGRVPRWVRVALGVLAVIALLPTTRMPWHVHPPRVAFFSDRVYERCIAPGDNVIMLPYDANGDSMLWQAESHFGFRLVGGYLRPAPPAAFERFPAVRALDEDAPPPGGARDVERLVRASHVSAIVVAGYAEARWRALLAPLGRPQSIAGVDLYLRRCR